MRAIPLVLLILLPIIIYGGSLAEATAGRSTACTGTLCISEIMANSLDSGRGAPTRRENGSKCGTPAPTPWTSSDGD